MKKILLILMFVGMSFCCSNYICIGENGCSMHTSTNGYILHEIETVYGSGYRVLKMENDNLTVIYDDCAIFQCRECNGITNTAKCECVKNLKPTMRVVISGRKADSEFEIGVIKVKFEKKKTNSELKLYKNDILAYEGKNSWSIEKSSNPSDILRQIFTPSKEEHEYTMHSTLITLEVLTNGCRYLITNKNMYVHCKSICDTSFSILGDDAIFKSVGSNYKCDPSLEYEYLKGNVCIDSNKEITDTEYYLVNGEKCTRKMDNIAIQQNVTIPLF